MRIIALKPKENHSHFCATVKHSSQSIRRKDCIFILYVQNTNKTISLYRKYMIYMKYKIICCCLQKSSLIYNQETTHMHKEFGHGKRRLIFKHSKKMFQNINRRSCTFRTCTVVLVKSHIYFCRILHPISTLRIETGTVAKYNKSFLSLCFCLSCCLYYIV